MKIKLEVKRICGVQRYYPLCDLSHVLCEMKKTPTLLQRDVDALRGVGFTFEFYEEK